MLSSGTPRLRRMTVGATVVGLCTAALVVGPALAEDAPAPAAVTPTAEQPAAVVAVQPAQARELKVLRRPRTSADAMPPAAQAVASPVRFGRNPQLARAVQTPTGRGWVVPGAGTVCLVVPDPVDGYATSCAPTAVVLSSGLTVGLADERRSVAVTLVPDDGSVAVTQEDRSVDRPAPDAAGVVVTDAGRADHLDVTTDAGTATTPMVGATELAARSAE